jgi:hypothetical protein
LEELRVLRWIADCSRDVIIAGIEESSHAVIVSATEFLFSLMHLGFRFSNLFFELLELVIRGPQKAGKVVVLLFDLSKFSCSSHFTELHRLELIA